jgi:hypothetical protein
MGPRLAGHPGLRGRHVGPPGPLPSPRDLKPCVGDSTSGLQEINHHLQKKRFGLLPKKLGLQQTRFGFLQVKSGPRNVGLFFCRPGLYFSGPSLSCSRPSFYFSKPRLFRCRPSLYFNKPGLSCCRPCFFFFRPGLVRKGKMQDSTRQWAARHATDTSYLPKRDLGSQRSIIACAA